MMHCFFYAPLTGEAEMKAVYDRIRRHLDRPDLFLSTNLEDAVELAPGFLSATQSRNEPMLERMDAFVIEGTKADAETGFLLAHAIALKKPTLYLYQRGTVAKVFSHLSLKELPAWIHVVSYHDRSLERHLEEFLMAAGGQSIKPAPRIKFTLRITSVIEDYLRFKTVNTKTSKADWVRDMLDRAMGGDADWQAYLRRRQRDED